MAHPMEYQSVYLWDIQSVRLMEEQWVLLSEQRKVHQKGHTSARLWVRRLAPPSGNQ